MGGDSCSEGCWFKSQHGILDGHFSHIFDVKIVMFVWKRPKISDKEAGVGPFKKTLKPNWWSIVHLITYIGIHCVLHSWCRTMYIMYTMSYNVYRVYFRQIWKLFTLLLSNEVSSKVLQLSFPQNVRQTVENFHSKCDIIVSNLFESSASDFPVVLTPD